MLRDSDRNWLAGWSAGFPPGRLRGVNVLPRIWLK